MRKVKDAVDLTTNEKIYFKGHAKATYLSDGRNVEDALGEIPTAKSDVFKAIYGVTTFEEIKAAYDSGKVVHCDYKTYCYVLSRILDVAAYFDAMSAPNSYRITCGTGGWTEDTYQLELKTNKVTSLSSSSTDTQYPSAKAVYDFVGKQGVIRQTQTWTRAADKGYDYVMSNLVRGPIPQANIDLFTSAGAIFNEESGYFELNGLTDISYEEMRSIYSAYMPNPWNNAQGMLLFNGIRTHMPAKNKIITFTPFNGLRLCYVCEELEVLCIIENGIPQFNNMQLALFNNYKLRKVSTHINVSAITSFSQTFQNCFSLTYIRLKGLKVPADFSQSARLDYDSILYMIKNSAAISATTITLHATALENAETAYLEDTTQDHATYPTLSDWALSKNIQIATA